MIFLNSCSVLLSIQLEADGSYLNFIFYVDVNLDTGVGALHLV